MKALLCIGRLISLEVFKGKTIRPKNKWLAWDGHTLQICTVTGVTNATLPASIQAKHTKFHDAAPKGQPFTADCPSPKGAMKKIGLLKALVYTVPKKIHSPEKNPYHWHHAFGDTGHNGGEYPTKVMPMLVKDQSGNLFIKRRKGNIYSIDQWIRG